MPTNKVTAGAIAGALTIIIVWGVKQFAKIDLPVEVAQSITVITSLVVSYIVPNAETP